VDVYRCINLCIGNLYYVETCMVFDDEYLSYVNMCLMMYMMYLINLFFRVQGRSAPVPTFALQKDHRSVITVIAQVQRTQTVTASNVLHVGTHKMLISCANMSSKCMKQPCIHLVY
jgi:hypothetical protein